MPRDVRELVYGLLSEVLGGGTYIFADMAGCVLHREGGRFLWHGLHYPHSVTPTSRKLVPGPLSYLHIKASTFQVSLGEDLKVDMPNLMNDAVAEEQHG